MEEQKWEVYQDNLGNIILADCLHSALIVDIEPNGNIVCESKWGNWGRYIHNLNYVPQSYCSIFVDECGNYVYEPFPIYFRYTQDEHFISIDEDNGASGHTFVCTAEKNVNGVHKTCSYTTECDGEFTVTSVNSSYHRIYCPDCYYSEYANHDLYMYSAAPEDYVVKCHDCSYTVECWESPEYYGDSNEGHSVDCPCGCYSFFEPHAFSYSNTEEGRHDIECADCGYLYSEDCSYVCSGIGNLYYHTLECSVCGDTDTEPHDWIRVGTKYRCLVCGRQETIIPTDVMSLSDEELSLLLSSMSEEELDQFIALLPEDAVARVTAILPRDDEHLTE